MQQTETYKLNLIETSDTFSPNPLNENAQKLENAIKAEQTALDQRVKVLEARRIVAGTYNGDGTEQIIQLGFTPALVLVHYYYSYVSAMAITGHPYKNTSLKIIPGGFSVSASSEVNKGPHYYLAIL